MNDRYQLIIYNALKEKSDANSRKKFIQKNDFDLLLLDTTRTIEINDISYNVVERRHFVVPSEFFGTTHFLIIDVTA